MSRLLGLLPHLSHGGRFCSPGSSVLNVPSPRFLSGKATEMGHPKEPGCSAPPWQSVTAVLRGGSRAHTCSHGRPGPGREAAAPRSRARPHTGQIGRRPSQAGIAATALRVQRPSADSPSVLFTMHLLVSLFLFTRQDRYDCGPPTPFNSPAQEVPHQRTHGPSERVTPVFT